MTVFETAILAAVIGVLLFVAAGSVHAIRQQAKWNLCERLMNALRTAMAAYHQETSAFPPGTADLSAGPAITAILAVPSAARALEAMPPVLATGRDPMIGVLDPWGHPLHYLTERSTSDADRRDVAANGGVPIFESAGRDGDFGRSDPSASGDNLRTNDLWTGPNASTAPSGP
jgi:hypothetical protein